MKRSTPTLLFAIFCLLFAAAAASAQTAPGRIKAIVIDPAGATIPNAFVQIQSKSNTKFTAGGFTDGNGEFISDPLPAGEYEVSCDMLGMKYLNENVTVRDETTVFVDVKVSYGANCSLGLKGTNLELDDADRKEIIALILRDAVIDHLIPDGHDLLKQKGPIILSLENLKREWVTTTADINLILMTKDEIQRKADRGKDFLHLAFGEWKIGKSCVFITVSNRWAVGKNSKVLYMSGGGSHYLYQKENGKWTGRSVGGWIS